MMDRSSGVADPGTSHFAVFWDSRPEAAANFYVLHSRIGHDMNRCAPHAPDLETKTVPRRKVADVDGGSCPKRGGQY